jgi:putative ABC transport system substrate-binding protein
MRRRDLMLLLGAAMVASRALRAQQKAMPVVGFLNPNSAGPFAPFVTAFQRGLSETGYVDGQSIAIEYRWAEGRFDRLPALASDLVARRVDVILAGGPDAARAAKDATATIPIVFHSGDDPVEAGLVDSLARPGGNLTGVAFMTTELNLKRLQLLAELVPQAKAIALLVPYVPGYESTIRNMQDAARATRVALIVVTASSESEIAAAFAAAVEQKAGGLVVPTAVFFNSHRDRVLALAARHAVPAIYSFRDFATAGGLISYGASLTAVYRQDGIFIGRILQGAKPADLPVEQPTKFELVINLKTAKALGLTVPQTLLARADEVIE